MHGRHQPLIEQPRQRHDAILCQQGVAFEYSFESPKAYGNPFTDVTFDGIFEQNGQSWVVPAFWLGGRRWAVRFAPPQLGDYSLTIRCSDPSNSIVSRPAVWWSAVAYQGRNPLLKHGMLHVSADKRHFEHSDGTPFLWLADTWWKCLARRLPWSSFRKLTADRKAKGFNAVQIVCGPYPDEAMMEPKWANEGGLPYFNIDFSRVNPAYFAFADRRIKHLIESGIVPVIVGGWGRPQAGGRSTLQQVGLDGFKRHWRHLIARYGAYPVVWIVGGEARDDYGPWSELSEYVQKTDPMHHPMCYHAPADPRDAIRNNGMFDFDMVAIGHEGLQTADATLQLLRKCRERTPKRPVLCGEACYEGHMQTNFADIQRYLFWSLMLSGAAGHTYGAAGIWQASVKGDPGIVPIYDWTTWDEGMDYPGSTQLGKAKQLLETYPWAKFEVHSEWTDNGLFAAGIPNSVRFVYQPKRGIYNWSSSVVHGLEAGINYKATYIDPVTFRRFPIGETGTKGGDYRPPAVPSPQDWILVLEAADRKPSGKKIG